MSTQMRLSEADLHDAIALARRIMSDTAVRAPEDLRAGFTLQTLSEELTFEYEDRIRRSLPLDDECRFRAATSILRMVREISWWRVQKQNQTRKEEEKCQDPMPT